MPSDAEIAIARLSQENDVSPKLAARAFLRLLDRGLVQIVCDDAAGFEAGVRRIAGIEKGIANAE